MQGTLLETLLLGCEDFVCLCRRKNCEFRIPHFKLDLLLMVCRPEGNDDYVRTAPDNPKKVRYIHVTRPVPY
jgi:hypothetical protein